MIVTNICKPNISAEKELKDKSHRAKRSLLNGGRGMLRNNDPGDLAEASRRHG